VQADQQVPDAIIATIAALDLERSLPPEPSAWSTAELVNDGEQLLEAV
jgi:hypothetical protein